jgi:hypothetical protein
VIQSILMDKEIILITPKKGEKNAIHEKFNDIM